MKFYIKKMNKKNYYKKNLILLFYLFKIFYQILTNYSDMQGESFKCKMEKVKEKAKLKVNGRV